MTEVKKNAEVKKLWGQYDEGLVTLPELYSRLRDLDRPQVRYTIRVR